MVSEGGSGRRFVGAAAAAIGLAAIATPLVARAESALSTTDLSRLSIEDLGNIEISSVSKTPERLSDSPAAVYVITHDDVIRSGATNISDILRLAPNLQVAQTNASQFVVTARGFSGNAADQNFSDKLLVLIDGRSVYTPLYSGVYWDAQDVLPEDIERIEVISGPGATLWGANAVNGVINIITRKSGETQGGLIDAGGGNLETAVSARYGGRISDGLTYRLYARDFIGANTVDATGANAHDGWYRLQGGFRLDWASTARDTVTFQGDAYKGDENQPGAPDQDISGGDVLGRWTHAGQNGSTLQVQAYFDRTERGTENGGGRFTLNTYDLDLQYNFNAGHHNQVVLGGGYRASDYRIVGTAQLFFQPAARTLSLANVFAQDTVAINERTKLILGLKFEDDPYSGMVTLPNARLSWKVSDSTLLWASASRAIRSPTPFDRDVAEKLGAVLFLVGGGNFRPERLTAYEAGLRAEVSSRASLSASVFYNVYTDLRSVEFTPLTLLPLRWGNEMRGDTYGVEIWGDYRVTPWWRLSASVNHLIENLKFTSKSSGALGVAQAGDDPKYQASLKSSMNLGPTVTLDGNLRYVGALPDPRVPAYLELDARLGWDLTERVRLSVSGFNLLHERHQEFPAPQANAVSRRAFVGLQWRF